MLTGKKQGTVPEVNHSSLTLKTPDCKRFTVDSSFVKQFLPPLKLHSFEVS